MNFEATILGSSVSVIAASDTIGSIVSVKLLVRCWGHAMLMVCKVKPCEVVYEHNHESLP